MGQPQDRNQAWTRAFGRRALVLAGLFSIAVCFGVCLCSARARADDRVPPDREAAILLRAMSYDRNLANRAGDELVVGVAYRSDRVDSAEQGKKILDELRKLVGYAVQGRRVKFLHLPFDSAAAFQSGIVNAKPAAVYVATCLGDQLQAARDAMRAKRVLSMSSCPLDVEKGLSITVMLEDGHATILLNLDASKSESVDFSSDFIRRTKVLEKPTG